MKFAEQLKDNDLRYREMQNFTGADSDIFLNQLYKTLVIWRDAHHPCTFAHSSLNFLACLKLAKKHEKQTHIQLGSRLYHTLKSTKAFTQHWKQLRIEHERHYPQYHDDIVIPHIIAHKAFEPYDALNMNRYRFRYHCEYVEVDVTLCASGQVILRHDIYTSDGKPLEDCHIDSIPEAVMLNTLLSGLTLTPASPKLMLDIKGFGREAEIIDGIAAELDTLGIDPSLILLASFNQVYLKYCFRKFPQYPRALITAGRALDDYVDFMDRTETDILICDENICCKSFVMLNKSHGFETWVYTVNNTGRFETFTAMGVNAVITDYPNLMAKR